MTHVLSQCGTLVELLRFRAEVGGDRPAYTFLDDFGGAGRTWTWAELERRARAQAVWLLEHAAPASRVLLAHPPGLEFLETFFGCLHAGLVPVPCHAPSRRSWSRFRALAADAGASRVVTSRVLADSAPAITEAGDLHWLFTEDAGAANPAAWRDPGVDPNAVAYLQYTSGSTARPRGVAITHMNVLANEHAIQSAFEQDESSVVVGWLPVQHDMGLVGNVLQPLYSGGRCVLMAPAAFLRRPRSWLEAITRHRATTSGGPNFAYDLCVRRVVAAERESLDLSTWRVAFNGAERVRADTLDRFAEAFAPCGFRRDSFRPCYGLAEATLLVTSGPGVTRSASRRALEQGRVEPARETADAQHLVSSGAAAAGVDVAIVDPASGTPVPSGSVGEIWVAGPSVADGYSGRSEETRATFGASLAGDPSRRFLRTGDLGFVDAGGLYVTGRLKDLVIVRGRNLHPEDVEETAGEAHSAVVPGGGAVFSHEVDGEERLVLVHEVERRALRDDLAPVEAALRSAVSEAHEAPLHAVVLLRPGALPRTTSGKVRRGECARLFRERELDAVHWSESRRETRVRRPALTRQRVMEVAPAERAALLAGHLRALVAHATGCAIDELDAGRAVTTLGVDSLTATEIRNAVEHDLGPVLGAAELVDGASMKELAGRILARLEAAGGPEPAGTNEAADDSADDAESPSVGERALWFLHRKDPGRADHHLAFAARVVAPASSTALVRGLERLVVRHESLRTCFPARDGLPRRALSSAPFAVKEIDASGWNADEWRARLREAARYPFDLENGPLWRAVLLHDAGGSCVALFAAHHVILDQWSLEHLLRDLGECLAAGDDWDEPPAPPMRVADFARWQRALLRDERGESLWRTWSRRLAAPPSPLDLPADASPTTHAEGDGAAHRFEVPPDVVRGLRALAERTDTTLFPVLIAAYAAWLGRRAGVEDVVVGTPMAGRSRAAFEDVVGYLVNLAPIRLDLSGDPTPVELVRRARLVVQEALESQDYPLPRLVERLRVDRDVTRPPLFQAGFSFHAHRRSGIAGIPELAIGEPGVRVRCGALELETVDLDHRPVPLELVLVVSESGNGLKASLDHRTDRFDAATVARMSRSLRSVLESIVRTPDARLSEIDPPEDECRELLETGAGEQVAIPEASVFELFRAQAERTPHAPALDSGRIWTYAELEDRVLRLANRLARQGAGPETPVAIALPRCEAFVVAVLATLANGAAYLPLDPTHPRARLASVLDDARARVVVTGRDGGDGFEGHACVLADDAALDAEPRLERNGDTAPEQLAYVIYTSGSSGTPKGVMIAHRGLTNFVLQQIRWFELGPGARVLFHAPPIFDASVSEIFTALVSGACLVVDPEIPLAGAGLAERLDRLGVTHWTATPSTLASLPPAELPRLRVLISASEACTAETLARWVRPGRRFFNGYGPTEVTVGTAMHVCGPHDAKPPIGRPFANLRCHVLDPRLRLVPAGTPGELCVGGPHVARGYLGQPGLTAERFVPDPHASEPGARMYRTGDRARWRSDGRLDFLGRLDEQLKVRGVRVEPAEVEAALERHPDVGAAVVGATADGPRRRLVAWVTGRDGRQPPAPAALREHLVALLPAPLIPSWYVPLERLPTTPSGKKDRRALPAPVFPAIAPSAEAAPRPGLERLVAEVWREALGVPHVGRHDNFFDLGAHSLMLAEVHERLRRRTGASLEIVDLFAHPTIAALASHLERGSRSTNGDEPDDPEAIAIERRTAARRHALARRRDAVLDDGAAAKDGT